MRKALILTAFLTFSGITFAQNAILGKHDADKDVNISADKMDADIKGKIVVYSGDVRAVQGDIRLRADAMKADQPNHKIYANGKVVVDSPTSGTVTGDNGIYDLDSKLVTLSGHVVLHKQGQVTMQGSLLTVNMVTGKATLGAGAVAATANQAAAPAAPGGRVTGVITPKSQTGTP
ncbi:MAG: LPS export ABC transporter periplasmic protein LptC [Alphaproteobacteria bacterium]|nr:LPS export ABC transporter periplasmic protein LptC [Alphaproteobacteria bacterium]